MRSQKHKQIAGKSKENDKSEALVISTEKPRGKRDMSKINCWNCRELGHFNSKCKQSKKSKDSKTSETTDSKEGTATAVNAVNTSSDDEAAMAQWHQWTNNHRQVLIGRCCKAVSPPYHIQKICFWSCFDQNVHPNHRQQWPDKHRYRLTNNHRHQCTNIIGK